MRLIGSRDHVVKVLGPKFTPRPGFADDPTLNPLFVGDFVVPRFTPGVWTAYMEICTRLKVGIEALAQVSVGGRITGIPDPDVLELLGANDLNEVGKIRQNELIEAARRIRSFCKRPKYDSLLGLNRELAQATVDYVANGNGCLEIVEDNYEAGGRIYGIGHIRSAFLRVNPTRTRWVQGIQAQSYDKDRASQLVYRGRYYRAFGDDNPDHRFIDRITGKFYAKWPSDVDEKRKGTAILHVKSYNPLDPYYGMPSPVPALNSIIENDRTGRFMIAFTEGGMRIPVLIVVEGGQLTPESTEKVEAIFNSDGMADEGAGKAAVVQPTVAGNIGANTKIRVERVDLGIDSLQALFDRRATNNAEISESIRFAGIFFGGAGDGQLTTRNAGVLKQLTYEHSAAPLAQMWEDALNIGVAPKIAPGGVFKIQRPNNLDPLQQASLVSKLKEGLTADDLRRAAKVLLGDGISIPTLKIQDHTDVPLAVLEAAIAEQAAKQGQTQT